MTTYTQDISLDISALSSYRVSISAKELDNATRYVNVTLTDNGVPIKADTKVTADFKGIKPDGTCFINPATINSDGTVTCELTEQVLACPGSVYAEVVLSDGDEVLSTGTFKILVEHMAFNGNTVLSSNQFLKFQETIDAIEQAIDSVNDITDTLEDIKATIDDATAKAYDAADRADASSTAAEDAIADLESKLSEWQDKADNALSSAQESIDALLSQLQSDANDTLDKVQSDASDAIADLESKSESILSDLQLTYNELNALISSASSALSEWQEKADTMLSSVQDDIDSQLSQLQSDSESIINSLQSDASDTLTKIQSDVDDTLAKIQSDASDMQTLLDSLISSANDELTDISDYKSQISEIADEIDALLAKYQDTDVSTLLADVEQLMAEVENLDITKKQDKPTATMMTIEADMWYQVDDENYPYCYDILVDGLTQYDRADIIIAPDSIEDAEDICQTSETLDGVIRLRASDQPSADIEIQIWIEQGAE